MTTAPSPSRLRRQSPPDTARVFTNKGNDHRDAKDRPALRRLARGGVDRDQQSRRDCRPALATPGKPQPVGGGRRHRHRRTQRLGQRRLRLAAARPDPGTVADHLYRRVADAVALLCDEIRDVAQHRHTADTGPPRVVDTEHVADIAQSGRRQQRVAQRVHGHVAVGVPGTAVDAGKQQAKQPARPIRFYDVHIGAYADSRVHWFTIAWASSRSRRVVILNASGSPSTTCTCPPTCSTSDASSVKSAVPACWYARCNSSVAKPCGVRTARRPARSGVARTAPLASTALMVSESGSAGTTAGCPARSASTTRTTRSGGV